MKKKRKVHVVGGAGYIGTHLCEELHNEGWEPEIWDVFMYQRHAHPENKYPVRDVTKLDPPGDGAPVIWLASPHMHPCQDKGTCPVPEWNDMYAQLQMRLPLYWWELGHDLVMVSSMRSVFRERRWHKDMALYCCAKHNMEQLFMGRLGITVLRFGTVWGGLDKFPARPQTALNRALLGELPDENYSAYGTHIGLAVDALLGALEAPKLGEVRNYVDDAFEPYTRGRLEEFITKEAARGRRHREIVLRGRWHRELRKTLLADRTTLLAQPHPVELFAKLFDLPLEDA